MSRRAAVQIARPYSPLQSCVLSCKLCEIYKLVRNIKVFILNANLSTLKHRRTSKRSKVDHLSDSGILHFQSTKTNTKTKNKKQKQQTKTNKKQKNKKKKTKKKKKKTKKKKQKTKNKKQKQKTKTKNKIHKIKIKLIPL